MVACQAVVQMSCLDFTNMLPWKQALVFDQESVRKKGKTICNSLNMFGISPPSITYSSPTLTSAKTSNSLLEGSFEGETFEEEEGLPTPS